MISETTPCRLERISHPTKSPHDAIGIINPTTDAITLLSVPDPYGGANGITTGPDGNLWFAVTDSDGIGALGPTGSGIEPVSPSMLPDIPFGFTLGRKLGRTLY